MVKQTGARAIILDSATALSARARRPNSCAAISSSWFTRFARIGLTAVILAEAPGDYGPLTTMGVEDYVCDLTLILRNIIDGRRRRRSIEVNKYRRSAHYKGEYPCTVTTRGLAVFPLDAKETAAGSMVERYPSGVEGLDAMTRRRLAAQLDHHRPRPDGQRQDDAGGSLRARRRGARRARRLLRLRRDAADPAAELPRDRHAHGSVHPERQPEGDLPVSRSDESRGSARRSSRWARGTEAVAGRLDSISSIEHASSEKGFRQFMIGVASILREHGRSALITQTIDRRSREHTAPYLSTIADAILTLDYSQQDYELDRHDARDQDARLRSRQHPYRLPIEPGGFA